MVATGDLQALLAQGEDLAMKEDFVAAAPVFEQALALAPDDRNALYGRAFTLRKLGELGEAAVVIDHAVELHQDDARLLAERGLLTSAYGDTPGAIEWYARAAEADPTHWAAARLVGELRAIGRYDEAQQALDSAVAAQGETLELLLERGWLADDAGDNAAALGAFDRALELDPTNENALQWRVTELRFLRRLDEAEAALDEAVERLGEKPSLLNERGWLEDDRNDNEAALAAFVGALELDENNETALQWRVTELRFLRRLDEAAAALDEAVERLGEKPSLLNERGWLEDDRGDNAAALAAFERTVELDPTNENALQWRVTELRRLRRFDEAAAALDEAVGRIGETSRLLRERGWLEDDRGDNTAALAAFERALELDPSSETALQWQVTELRLLRRLDEAASVLAGGLGRLGERPSLVLEQSFLAGDQGSYERALELVDKVLALESGNTDALSWRATVLRRLRRFDEAEHAFDAAVAVLGSTATLLLERAAIDTDQQRFDEAIVWLHRADAADPASPTPALQLLDALQRAKRTREARDVAEQIRERFRDDAVAREQVGWFFLGQNSTTEAKRDFDHILARDSANVLAQNGMGGVYFQQDDYDLAEEAFRRAVAADPSPTYLLNLAWALIRQGHDQKREEAISVCQEILASDRRNATAYGCLGVIAFEQGRLIEAEERLRATIELDPENGAYADLGALYVKMGWHDEAKRMLDKAVELDPNDVQGHRELGGLMLELGQPAEALREFRRAQALAPDSEEAVRGLGLALWQVGRPEEAERVLREGLRRLDERRRWRLHLALSRLLVQRSEDLRERDLLEEALRHSAVARRLEPLSPDPYFHAGVVHFKLGEYWESWKSFRDCLARDETDYEAARYAAKLSRALLHGAVRSSLIGSTAIAVISFSQLVLVWVLFLTHHISDAVFGALTPILLGLFVIAFLLPSLVRLKLPGLEAEVSSRRETVSAGPTPSDVGFASEGGARGAQLGVGSASPLAQVRGLPGD